MKVENHRKNSFCRLCNSAEVSSVLKLASTPPANAFISKDKLNENQRKYPLELFFCEICNHVQLLDIVDPTELFENYVYVSGTSTVFVDHFSNYAKDIVKQYNPSSDNYVLDIGSNDGTFLRFFKNMGYRIIGVDPAKEISKKATEEGITTINDFFNLETARKIKNTYSEASIITANNVFAHCDDLQGMTQAVNMLLAPNGIFVFEVSYLVDVYNKTLFDTIYHEHLSYHSVIPLVSFFKNNNMELIDVKKINTHGGSIRCVVQKSSGHRKVNKSVQEFVQLEKSMSFDKKDKFINFSENISKKKRELNKFLHEIKSENKTIVGFGAPAKATTLMYEFGLDNDVLEFIVDDSPWKQELYSPGLHIPILSSSYIKTFKPDYLLILAWNFANSIIKKNQEYTQSGGKFIIPLPNLEVV